MKILYVSTISNTVNTFLIPHIRMLVDEGHTVDVAFNIEQEVNSEIIQLGCKVHELPLQRSPLSKDNYIAYKMLKNIIISSEYDLVHTHTPVASAIVRLVCRKLSDVKVFYTAHGFHFYKGAPLKNWLIYYPLEKWLSRYTDTLITINKEDFKRAKNKLNAHRVEYIPGVGLDLEKFKKVVVDRDSKRVQIGVPKESFVILSVGELNKNKNHEVVIRALANLNIANTHYVICGIGPLKSYLLELATELGIRENVHLLGYRNDVLEFYRISDIFVFPSLREGLPVSVMEAMASGLPVVCSNIRGNIDLIQKKEGGYIHNSKKYTDFSKTIEKLIIDEHLRTIFGEKNKMEVKKYSLKNILNNLNELYDSL